MTETTTTGTRERLLDAAETLLLGEHYDAVSVRAICAAAGANPAAAHYHFGSKDALIAALLEDRLGPLWEHGLAEVATREPESVPALVDAVLGPFRTLAADPVGRSHLRLLARFVPGRHPVDWHRRWFRMESWTALLPELDPADSRRRWMLAFDLIITRFGRVDSGHGGPSESSIATLRSFVIAGLTAPRTE